MCGLFLELEIKYKFQLKNSYHLKVNPNKTIILLYYLYPVFNIDHV